MGLQSDKASLDLEGLVQLTGLSEGLVINNFINNEFVSSEETLDIVNPANNKLLGALSNASETIVNSAVESANQALPSWSKLSRKTRSDYLNKIASAIESPAWFQKLALAESLEGGKVLSLCKNLDIPRAAENFRYFANFSETWFNDPVVYSDNYESGIGGMHYVVRKPVGVYFKISPLYLLTWKIAPALAAGCTCVCKPNLCKIFLEVGLPPGVVNMVFGLGQTAGNALVTHPKVPAISFTGGTVTGRKVAVACASSFKKLSLELGGKNPSIILDDCDLDEVVASSARAAFSNQGQICLCMSRIYVQDTIYDKFVEKLVAYVQENYKLGVPQKPDTKVGVLSSNQHREKVKGYVELTKQEGGIIRCGGTSPHSSTYPDLDPNGAYYEPTIVTDLDPNTSQVLAEEVFGPFVSINKFSTDNEAINYANNTKYGLAACVWGKDIKRLRYIAQNLDTGMVWVNCWLLRHLSTPFGGTNQSGVGREGGSFSMNFFTKTTNVTLAD